MHGTIESAFRVEWRPLAELGPVATEWRTLTARALESNVFYEPAFALAAAPVFGLDVGAGLVWSRTTPPRLLGAFPARIELRRYGLKLPVLVGWTHPYSPFGAPLVDREAAEAVIDAWFQHLAGDPELPDLLLMPYFPAEGPLARAFTSALLRRGGKAIAFGRHRRALLAPTDERAGYLDHAIGHKKRKELRRQRKRLAEAGVITSNSVSEPSAVANALGDFLALEASGWKGRAGTAARADPAVCKFLETAITELAAEGKAQIDRLFLDTRPVAAMVSLRSGANAWCWKTAYDENHSHYSPGMQLLLDLTQRMLDDPTIARADSCATANHPMIDHIWRERLPLADCFMRIGPGGPAAFALACALEAVRRAAITGAKALLHLLRR